MTAGTRTFSRTAVLWLVGISATSLVLSLFVVGFGDDLSTARTLGADTYSFSAIGHRALRHYLEELDVVVRVSRDPWVEYVGPDVPLVVAAPIPGVEVDGYDLNESYDVAWTMDAPLVLVLPKWIPIPDQNGQTLAAVTPMARQIVDDVLEPVVADSGHSAAGRVRRLRGERVRICTDPDGTQYSIDVRDLQLVVLPDTFGIVVDCEDMALIAHRPGTEQLAEAWIVSDPDILNNHGLLLADHALLTRDLFVERLRANGVVFDETVHGYGSGTRLAAELVRFPLVLAVLHGLLVGGVIVWSGVARFGKPRPRSSRFRDGKLVLIESSAQLLSLGGHSRESLQEYYEQTVRGVGAHYFFAADLPLGQLEERLQAISDSRKLETDLSELREKIRRQAHGRGAKDSAVRPAMRLHRWRQEMIHGR